MKRNIISSLMFLTVLGCSEADLMLYQDEPRVYLGGYSRSESTTFYYDEASVERDTIYISVETMGGPKDYDRPVTFSQVTKYDTEYVVENGVNVDSIVTENPYNAVPGTHYVPFDSDEAKALMVIPANEVSALIPVILLRDPSLKKNEYYLDFELSANSEFKIGGAKEDVRYEIIFADKLVKPNFWSLIYDGYYFGAYSTRKHEFMIDVSGKRVDDEWWDTQVTGITGAVQYYQNLFKAALSAFNNAPENIASGAAPLRENADDPTSALIVFP